VKGEASSSSEVAVAVLAAGASRRLGTPKQLVHFRGQPLLARTVQAACNTTARRVAVVLGARSDQIAPCLAGLDVDILLNHDWPEGIATSVRRAAAWAITQGVSGLLLTACDQPLLGVTQLQRLIDVQTATGCAAASAYAGLRGIPACFPRALLPHLLQVRGDQGAGPLLRASPDTVEVPWPEGSFDLDQPSDLARLAEAVAR
jgi:CTP:molybdopterin cytidylyltransferase MocA